MFVSQRHRTEHTLRLLLVALALVGAATVAAQECPMATSEGWDDGSTAGWGGFAGSTVTPVATGGNPDGSLELEDVGNAGIVTRDPSWGGDWTGIHEISVDYRAFGAADGIYAPYVRLRRDAVGNGWTYYSPHLVVDDGSWHRFTVPFDAAWSDGEAEAAGWSPSLGTTWTWAETAVSVTYLIVQATGANDGEPVGIDNVIRACWMFADDFESGTTGTWSTTYP